MIASDFKLLSEMVSTSPSQTPQLTSPPLGRWPERWWSGLAAGSAAGVMTVVWGLAMWDRTTGLVMVDLLLWSIAGLLFLALFDGILSLLLLTMRGLARLFPVPRLSAALRTWRTRYGSFPLAALWLSLGWVLFPDSPLAAVQSTATGTLVILACMAAGAIFGTVRGLRQPRRWLPALLAALPVVATAAWLLWPGPGIVSSLRPDAADNHPVLANPGALGPYEVRTFTYGSGNDSRRPEFGAATDFISQTVDGSQTWDGFGGVVGWWWERYWGFDLDSLPLNGLVWYPDGDGIFPLVLVVHGNHAANRFSDPGYAYLGRELATRGFIAVSVDENFLNGTLLGDPAGNELALRGWLLLEHLAQWQRWNSDPGFLLHDQVDTEAVALIGHSRGGEAAIAAVSILNGSCGAQVDSDVVKADIDAVVAIAPSDGLYRPCGSQARLRDTSYLTINGGMDGDVGTFYGLAQYGRTRVAGDEFKAYAYLHRANHGQFNQSWGFGDLGVFDWLVLDRASLLTADDQEQAARVIVSAFLEATLHGQAGYRDMFRRPDSFADALPDDVVVTRYEDALLDTVEGQDPSLATEVLLQDVISRRALLKLRVGDRHQDDSAMSLTWQPESDPSVTYRMEAPYSLSSTGIVSMDLASASDDYVPSGISVTLHAGLSTSARVPLDLVTAYRPPLVTPILKWSAMGDLIGRYDWDFQTERILQTYELPAASFTAANPDLDLSTITALEVTFEGGVAGTVLIDEVGFRNEVPE
jgi:dienelactone hydrolase